MVGFRDGRTRAHFDNAPAALFPTSAWYGKGVLRSRAEPYPLKANLPPAGSRMRPGGKPELGARAMNVFTTRRYDQRMWSKATITMNQRPTRRAASRMTILSWNGTSVSVDAFGPSTFSIRCGTPRRATTASRNNRLSRAAAPGGL
jgi:hypothetical protein